MYKIGVMSDTHLPRVTRGLKRIVEKHFKNTDLLLHAGDIGAPEVLHYLESCGVLAVRGNMDCFEASDVPFKRLLTVGKYKIGLIHGWGAPDDLPQRLRAEFGQIDCLVFGHSHIPENYLERGELYFNPGSMFHPRRMTSASIGFIYAGDSLYGEIVTLN